MTFFKNIVTILVLLFSYSLASDDECIRKYFECISNSKETMEGFIETDKKCCKKVINDEDDVWIKNFNECFDNEEEETYMKCFDDLDDNCRIYAEEHFNTTMDIYAKFDLETLGKMERPKTEDECDYSFSDNIEKLVIQQCEKNKEDALESMCEVILNYYFARN